MLPHPVPSAEGTPFDSDLWKAWMEALEKDAAGDKPVSYQIWTGTDEVESMV
jgi:hypothetical protein